MELCGAMNYVETNYLSNKEVLTNDVPCSNAISRTKSWFSYLYNLLLKIINFYIVAKKNLNITNALSDIV